jgi:hypothetical protein
MSLEKDRPGSIQATENLELMGKAHDGRLLSKNRQIRNLCAIADTFAEM